MAFYGSIPHKEQSVDIEITVQAIKVLDDACWVLRPIYSFRNCGYQGSLESWL